ncbi:MAG: macro domain-containing protein [Clostridium sp.]|nr:macro domain-containing protein [Clostridium sp.]
MKIKIIKADLFSFKNKCYLAHCISSDFALGAGIAVQFNKHFNMRSILKYKYPTYSWDNGDCILENTVFNLVTKEKYWHKPTYNTLEKSLIKMRDIALQKNIKNIAMPLIGCGLDRLDWDQVKSIIENVFNDTDIQFIICIK